MKRTLEIEAAQVLAQMDTLTGGAPTPSTRQVATRQVSAPKPRA